MLQRKYDKFNVHKRVKKVIGEQRRYLGEIMVDEDKIVIATNRKVALRKRYLKDLFDDIEHPLTTEVTETDPDLLEDEVRKAIQIAKSGKATGLHKIPTKIIKLMCEKGMKMLTRLFNNICNTVVIPPDWLISTFITLPMTRNLRTCKNHRTISLMSYALKILLKVVILESINDAKNIC